MPLYDYVCAACGRRFEVIHGVHADPPAACPLCGSGPIRKAIAAPAVHFKGSGWAKKERRASAASKSSTDGGHESTDGGHESTDAGHEPTGSGRESTADEAGSSSSAGTEAPTPASGSADAGSNGSAGGSKGTSTGRPSKPASSGD